MLRAVVVIRTNECLCFNPLVLQWEFLLWSGVSQNLLWAGLVLLLLAGVLHTAAAVGCFRGLMVFRDGQVNKRFRQTVASASPSSASFSELCPIAKAWYSGSF